MRNDKQRGTKGRGRRGDVSELNNGTLILCGVRCDGGGGCSHVLGRARSLQTAEIPGGLQQGRIYAVSLSSLQSSPFPPFRPRLAPTDPCLSPYSSSLTDSAPVPAPASVGGSLRVRSSPLPPASPHPPPLSLFSLLPPSPSLTFLLLHLWSLPFPQLKPSAPSPYSCSILSSSPSPDPERRMLRWRRGC